MYIYKRLTTHLLFLFHYISEYFDFLVRLTEKKKEKNASLKNN